MIEHLAVVGATGAVGREFCSLLDQRSIRPRRLSLFASHRSIGASIPVGGKERPVAQVDENAFEGVDFAVFSAGAACSRNWAPVAVRAGAVVIDNSSAFRMEPGVPLVIPEVNPDDARRHKGIVANPNCSAALLAVVLGPLHRAAAIRRVVVSTYQAASGAGAAAMSELLDQTRAVLQGEDPMPRVFPHPIAFNLFSHDSAVGADGLNGEERKVIDETRKVLREPELAMSVTCVRVPVVRAHCASVNIEFEGRMDPDAVRAVLGRSLGIRVQDDRLGGRFPMPVEASGGDEVLVGRIRPDPGRSDGRGIDLFLAGDQLRKGAALNALQILQLLESAEGLS